MIPYTKSLDHSLVKEAEKQALTSKNIWMNQKEIQLRSIEKAYEELENRAKISSGPALESIPQEKLEKEPLILEDTLYIKNSKIHQLITC